MMKKKYSNTKPNILWIMTDQMRYDGVGFSGNPLLKTPNLDRLAADGMFSDNFFINSPVCVPSRISFFTGRYAHSHKNRVNNTPLKASEKLFPQYLKDTGYNTACVGKLHFYPPTKQQALQSGFNECLLHDGTENVNPHSDYVKWNKENNPCEVSHNKSIDDPSPGQNPFTTEISEEYFETTWVGAKSCEFIKNNENTKKPFFLFTSFFKPHAPFRVPEPFASMYNDVDFPLPDNIEKINQQDKPIPVQKLIARQKRKYTHEELQWRYRSYYGNISHIDREVGRIATALTEAGLLENTIILFTSDHGDQLLEHGVMGKNVFYESSIKVPLIMKWGNKLENKRYNTLTESVDILPTLFDMCNIEVPYHTQGKSFKNLIMKDNPQNYIEKDTIFCENIIPEVITSGGFDICYQPGVGVDGVRFPDAKMVRTKEWKYIHHVGNKCELFNIKNDPSEKNNLAGQKKYEKIENRLKGHILDWLITADETEQIAERWLI